jgi:D-glutamate cyclase
MESFLTNDLATARDRMARDLGEVLDHFLTVPFCLTGGPSAFAEKPIIGALYGAARKLTGDLPLTYAAARALTDRVPAGGRVIIGTGFIVPPYLRLEGDGPIGTPFLARALAITREARPIVVTEPANVAALETVMRASGLQLASLEEALEVPHKTAVVPFPIADATAAREHAARLLDRVAPDAVITIEKPSRNNDDRYHNGMVVEVTDVVARLDYLLDQARERGALTIGFGDGGNEMGMGNIHDVAAPTIPNGQTIAAVTGADVLVVAASASWGSYGVEACLAALAGMDHALHGEEMERRMLDATAMAGIVDPLTGMAEGWLDGVPPEVNYAIVRLINYMYQVRARPFALDLYRSWGGRKEEGAAILARPAPRLASVS